LAGVSEVFRRHDRFCTGHQPCDGPGSTRGRFAACQGSTSGRLQGRRGAPVGPLLSEAL
jgi:hypothetical protein